MHPMLVQEKCHKNMHIFKKTIPQFKSSNQSHTTKIILLQTNSYTSTRNIDLWDSPATFESQIFIVADLLFIFLNQCLQQQSSINGCGIMMRCQQYCKNLTQFKKKKFLFVDFFFFLFAQCYNTYFWIFKQILHYLYLRCI